MTEPAPDAPQPSEPAPERRGRGRPRSRETLARDEAVIAALQGGVKSREQLAQELNEPSSLIYLALWRLKRQGRVEKTTDVDARHAWHLVS